MSKSFIYNLSQLKYNNIIASYPDTNPITIIGFLGLLVSGHGCYAYLTQKQKQIIISKKYQFCRNGFSEFIIVDTNNKHYNMNNSFWYWKWNSLEDWDKLATNDVILIKYYGWRVPILGLFPNIVSSNRLETSNIKNNYYLDNTKDIHPYLYYLYNK
jgi:hypothetical protein